MDKSLLLALAQTLFPFVISPGASFVLTLSASTAGVPFAALRVWAGTALGFGLRHLPHLAALRHVLLKAGGLFMIWLGGKSLLAAW